MDSCNCIYYIKEMNDIINWGKIKVKYMHEPFQSQTLGSELGLDLRLGLELRIGLCLE